MNALAQFFEKWLRFSESSLSESSATTYRHCFKGIARHFRKYTIEEITTNDVAAWMARAVRVDRLKGQSVNYRVDLLRRVLDFAIQEGMIQKNPVSAGSLPKMVVSKTEKRWFNAEQYRLVMSALCKDTNRGEYWLSACTVAWHTGLRMVDVANLRWASVDFPGNQIVVIPQKTKNTGRIITIPMEDELREHLVAAFGVRTQPEFVNRPFHELYVTDRQFLCNKFVDLCRSVELRDHSFHSFRHGFATRLLNSGADAIVVASMTGQTLKVLANYAHISSAAKRAAMSAANSI